MEETRKNDVLPLNDLALLEVGQLRYVSYPGTSRMPEVAAANTHGVSFEISAEVEPTDDSRGVVCS